MTDERLQGLLGSLRHERMDRIADDKIRARLETAWTARMEQRSLGSRLRRLAPLLATLVLFVGVGAATMTSGGESPLYGLRVTIEDAAIALHADPQDRAEYVVSLLEQRQAEAARLEAEGNAAAASRARQIEQDTLRVVRAMLPVAPEVEPAPAPVPTDSPTPTPTPTPTSPPTPTVAPTATPTVRPSTPRPTTPPATSTPTPTPTPVKTATPTPAPTGTPFPVTVTGHVKNADGTLADGVCVLLQTGGGCLATTVQGQYQLTISARLNQTVTLYFTRTDGTVLWKGTASAVVKSGTLLMPDVKLIK